MYMYFVIIVFIYIFIGISGSLASIFRSASRYNSRNFKKAGLFFFKLQEYIFDLKNPPRDVQIKSVGKVITTLQILCGA